MMDVTDVELMTKISAISAQAKQAIIEEQLAECDQLLIQRQILIEQLVMRSNPAEFPNTHAFLTRLMADDQTQIASLKRSKSTLESQQATTKRSAKSINRYLTVKQY